MNILASLSFDVATLEAITTVPVKWILADSNSSKPDRLWGLALHSPFEKRKVRTTATVLPLHKLLIS
jgi:hypothetical protein